MKIVLTKDKSVRLSVNLDSMDHALPIAEHYKFLCEDFERAWNQLATTENQANGKREYGRGNYMFALMCMVLIELTKRTAEQFPEKNYAASFSAELHRRDSRYFIELGSDNPNSKALPFHIHGNAKRTLLALLYDLARNGKAHFYDAVISTTTDPDIPYFSVSFTGARFGRMLIEPTTTERKKNHLKYSVIENEDKMAIAVVGLRTDYLFQDLKATVEATGISSITEKFQQPFARDVSFNLQDLKTALEA